MILRQQSAARFKSKPFQGIPRLDHLEKRLPQGCFARPSRVAFALLFLCLLINAGAALLTLPAAYLSQVARRGFD